MKGYIKRLLREGLLTENNMEFISGTFTAYHGSPFRFETLDSDKIGSTNDKGEPMGFFFTSDKNIAKNYYSKETGSGLGNLLTTIGLGSIKGYKPTVYVSELQFKNIPLFDFKGNRTSVGMDKNKIIKDSLKKYGAVILKDIKDGPNVNQTVYVVANDSFIKTFEINK